MDKIQMLKMILDACGNAGAEASKLAVLYFGMDLLKFVLLLLMWVMVLVCIYRLIRHLIAVRNPPELDESLVTLVRDNLIPSQIGTIVDYYERKRVTAALSEAWKKSREKAT